MAVRAAGRLVVARASIQAVEATGPVKAIMEPDTSQAMPTLSGGAGTRRRVVRVNGSAVGRAPAARWASAAIAWRISSRPGGVAEVVVTAARLPDGGVAQRAGEPAGGGLLVLAVGSRVPPVAAAGPGLAGATGRRRRAQAACWALARAVFSARAAAAWPGGNGGRRGVLGGDGGLIAAAVSATAEATGDGGPPASRWAAGRRGRGVGRDAEDAAPAPAEPQHGAGVVVGGGVGGPPDLPQRVEALLRR